MCCRSSTSSAAPLSSRRWPTRGRSSSPRLRPAPAHASAAQIRWFGPSPRAGSKPVDKLGNILPRVLRRQPGGAKFLGVQVATAFRMVIGVEPAGLCDEIELHSGTLLATTPSPPLADHL